MTYSILFNPSIKQLGAIVSSLQGDDQTNFIL